MKSNTIIWGALAVAAIVVAAKCKTKQKVASITLENIRRGVAEGWYDIVEIYAAPSGWYVKLRGKNTDGEEFIGSYAIAQEDFNQLKDEGYTVAQYDF